ncbi:MAG: PHP domain-containing protein [Oscillospiraceae bacterium]|jgi:predicted metal-dependent phosphoesterase TrpH
MSRFYQFDVHMHTAETSKCGRIPAADLVDRYKAAGYDGIFITDHLHEEYISLLYCYDDWNTCVDRFLDGYHRAKKRGEEVGLTVLLGVELRFAENNNDYLVYGIDEEWLRSNPYPFRMGPVEFFRRFQEELLIIHAHPFRDNNQFIRLDCIHGLEVVNTHPDHQNYNEVSLEAFRNHPHLYPLCGSDTHRKGQECAAWVQLEHPVRNVQDYIQAVRQGAYTLGCKEEKDQAILNEMIKLQRKERTVSP